MVFTYRKVESYRDSEWTGNQNVKAKYLEDKPILLIRNEKDKSIKEVKLKDNFNKYILSVSDAGKYIGLCILGPMEDENKWVIIDTNTLEFIPIPMGQKEYSCGTIAWSNDDRYLVIDIERITQTDSNCVDIDKAGILIFDTKTKKVIQKNLHDSTDSWLVQGLKNPQVLFLNAEKNLCIYNANANISMVIYKEKLSYVLWGPKKGCMP